MVRQRASGLWLPSLSETFRFGNRRLPPIAGGAPQVLVQHNGNSGTQPTNYLSSPTSGNLLVAFTTGNGATGTNCTIADTRGFTWQRLPLFQSSTGGDTLTAFWTFATATGAEGVTMTWVGATWSETHIAEFSGVPLSAVLDGPAQTAQGTSATINTPSFTTKFPDDLILHYVTCGNSGTPNSPWTLIDATAGDPTSCQLDVGPGTYNPNVTQTSGTFASMVFALGASGDVGQPFVREYPSQHFGPF